MLTKNRSQELGMRSVTLPVSTSQMTAFARHVLLWFPLKALPVFLFSVLVPVLLVVLFSLGFTN
jgi:hypothetical protein